MGPQFGGAGAETRPEMFIGTMVDITESKHAQDKLQATQTELARVTI